MYTDTTTPPRPLAHKSTPKSGGFYLPTDYTCRVNSPTRHYSKPALNENELVKCYLERGLTIADPDRAARYLRHIGYYRLSPYTIPFQADRTTHSFNPGTTFDDILNVYVFDRELRLLTTDALERVEVAVRAATSNIMSTHSGGGAFWYTDSSNYQNHKDYSATVERIEHLTSLGRQYAPSTRREQTDRLHYPDALTHYLDTYTSPTTPPSWLVIELLTAGELQRLYAGLARKYRKAIARELHLTEPVLQSWLKSYVRVRNICAHHGRLWNRFLGVYPAIPKSGTVRWLSDRSTFDTSNPEALERKRLYPVLVSLQSTLFTISPHSSWALRLQNLLEKYPRIPLNALGMRKGWAADKFWQDAFKAASQHE